MTAYAYHPNTSVMHASASLESVRTLGNDERRAIWAAKYCVAGWHRRPQKPRIRIPVTVPKPLSNLPTSPDVPSRERSGGAGRQFPVSKRDLPDMTPEQLEQWEAEMMGPF